MSAETPAPKAPAKPTPRAPKKSAIDRFLTVVERAGNTLPHPATLFALLAGLHRILTEMVTNFTGFAPLGTVLVAMLGIGIAEGQRPDRRRAAAAGALGAAKLLTFVIVFAGVLSNTASEVGYVLLVPLAAMIFLAAGRHPLAGLAAAFAGVSGGYSANLLLGTIDPLLAGLTQEAARIVDPAYGEPGLQLLLHVRVHLPHRRLGTWVTEKASWCRAGRLQGEREGRGAARPDAAEKRGLLLRRGSRLALFTALILLWGLCPRTASCATPRPSSLLHSPFMSGIVPSSSRAAVAVGIAYGIGAGTFRATPT
jgi:aminobenzoyl-glutamate transport protein